jgi:FMN reductase (NADPH)
MVRPRLPLEAILHWGSYDPEGEADLLQDYDRLMVETGIYQGRQVGAENPLPAMQYGWTEHSARRVAQVQRPHLREVLQEQGFELK